MPKPPFYEPPQVPCKAALEAYDRIRSGKLKNRDRAILVSCIWHVAWDRAFFHWHKQEEDADDIAQEVALKVLKRFEDPSAKLGI